MRIIALPASEIIDQLEESIGASGADLAILPERWSGGVDPNRPELSDGRLAQAIADVAVQKHCAIMAPYLELEHERRFSSLLFVGADGHGICSYRKTHLSLGDDAEGLARGNWMTIVPFRGQRIGLLLGDDLLHPEMTRCLALEGASLLIAASTMEPSLLTALARVRAVENGLPVLVVSGGDPGRAVACDPEGQVLVDRPIPAVFDLPPIAEENLRQHADRRRAELYRAIVEPAPRT